MITMLKITNSRYLPVFNTPTEGGGGAPAPTETPEGEGAPAGEEVSPATSDPVGETSLLSEGGENKTEGNEDTDGEPKEDEGTVEPLTVEDIELPEGFDVPEGGLEPFVDLINNTELGPKERAAEFVRLHTEAVTASIEMANKASAELWSNTVNEWRESTRALPEIGGDNLDATLAGIKSGLNKLGATDATYEALNLTGAGNHPELIKILHAATAHLREGTNPSTPASPGGGEGKTLAERLYPSKE